MRAWKFYITIWHFFFVPVVALSALTKDRFIHLIWAFIFSLVPISVVAAILRAKGRAKPIAFLKYQLVYLMCPSGIHYAYALTTCAFVIGNIDWTKKLLVLFGYGLSSHLISDIIPGGNVVGIPAQYDMPFLFINGVMVFLLSGYFHWQLVRSQDRDSPKQITTT